MANGYFERGEVYWVSIADFGGNEVGGTRPGLIVSTNDVNTTGQVVIAYLTTSNKDSWKYCVPVDATKKRSYVKCDTLITIQTNRLRSLIGTLNSAEQKAVDDALERTFDLGYADTAAVVEKDKEIEALKVKIAELTGEVAREQAKNIELQAKHENELLSYKLENTMWQKCYERSMDMLVDTKVNSDLSRRTMVAEPEPIVPKEPVKVIAPEEPVLNTPVKVVVPKEPVEVKVDRVDINHCTQTQLKKVGMSEPLARAIIAKRPFESVEDLKKVQGMNKKKYQIIEPKVCCTPLEIIEIPAEPVMQPVMEPEVAAETVETEGKLNINALDGPELIKATGLCKTTCYTIVGYRKKHGPFEKLEDLLNVRYITKGSLYRFRDKFYFGPVAEESQMIEESPKVEEKSESVVSVKANINTDTAEEIHEKLGLNISVCYYITGYRRKHGKYNSVEELLNVSRFTDHHMKKYGHLFEV